MKTFEYSLTFYRKMANNKNDLRNCVKNLKDRAIEMITVIDLKNHVIKLLKKVENLRK